MNSAAIIAASLSHANATKLRKGPNRSLAAAAVAAGLASQCFAPSSAQAQTSYDWSMQDDIAQWGSDAFALTGGSYTRDYQILGTNPNTGYSGSHYQGGSEGPYDGRVGNIYTKNAYGAYTRTDPGAVFNLGVVGSSATIRTSLNLFNAGSEDGVSIPLKAHAMQFGLSANSNYIGETGSDALIIALSLEAANGNPTGDRWMKYSMDIYDETSDTNPTDGIWNWSPLVNLGGAADHMKGMVSNVAGEQGIWHAFELKYTNIGSNQLRLDIGVMALTVSGRNETDTLLSATQIYQTTQTINLATSPLNLTALRPAFGFNVNDALHSGNALGSGVSFDWESAYPTGFSTTIPAPEPAAWVLGGLSLLGMTQRRRRSSRSGGSRA